jgi:hypothetical protein
MATFLALIKALPSLIGLLNQFMTWLQQYETAQAKAEAIKKLHGAVQGANSSGDTSQIENLFSPQPVDQPAPPAK